MLRSSNIVSFVATKKPELARKFYDEIIGLKLVYEDPFAIVFDANGIMLRVSKGSNSKPVGHTVLGWDVKNIRAEVKTLLKRGVSFERFPGLEQDGLGVWSAPSGAKVAWFKDPDGNLLSLTQFPKP